MNVREMAREIADQHNMDIKEVQKVLYGMSAVVVRQVSRGGTARLGSLGTFASRYRKPRPYKNIKTGVQEVRPGRSEIVFKPAAKLKKAIT